MDSSTEEDDPPILGGLFSDNKDTGDSSGEDSCSESDREWRDAVKAAVETEIQYQVQLRLSLESPKRKSRRKQEESLDRDPDSRKIKLQDGRVSVEDATKTGGTSLLNGSEPRPRCVVDDVTMKTSSLNVNESSLPHHQPVAVPCVNNDKREKKEPTTTTTTTTTTHNVYDYLHLKYGTPYEQLQRLASNGKFQCVSKEECSRITGMDDRVRWPVECSIIQPTPDLSSNHVQRHIPFFPDGPVLGQARPSFNREPDECAAVFDRSPTTDVSQVLGDGVLKFESRFESGNLQQAIKVGANEYDLLLNTDLYTERHTQWFYFQVSGMQKGELYTFNIINFRKHDSLYNNGMKMLMYSDTDKGWTRVGQNICYKKLPAQCNHTSLLKQGVEYYYLSWKMEFPHDGDTCWFAHCYPYTYSHLLKVLDSYERDNTRKEHFRREVLCHSLAGNVCPLLTITDFQTPEEVWAERLGVVFSARVHPGETNSSWVMDGVMEFLTSEHKHAKYLRSKFIFKIIPMLNPDGVIVGNYRVSLSGVDLNRVYKNPIEKLFPTVASVKKLIKEFNDERKVALYVDLHGHSRSYNVFMYGCHTPQCDHQQFLEERAVPWMLSQISKDKFSFKKCKFATQRCKESTGRISIWREGIANSFTMEASFCGTNLTRPTPLHFTSDDLTSMGRELCEVLLKLHRYNKSNSYRFKVNSCIAEYFMESINDGGALSIPPLTLPDVVTSTKPLSSCNEEKEPDPQAKRKSRRQMAKILQQFHAVSMKKLQAESSTSGSDSEDDEFQYSKRKSRSKNRQKKQKHHRSLSQKPSNANQPDHKLPKLDHLMERTKNIFDIDTLSTDKAGENTKTANGQLKQHASVNSAPPRLQGGSTHPQHGWRFVNRYSNRSNGGIPIFSEERLKERAEKKEKLRSLSQIQSSDKTELPILTSPSNVAGTSSSYGSCSIRPLVQGGGVAAIRPLARGEHSSAVNLPSLTWKPYDSQKCDSQRQQPFTPNTEHASRGDVESLEHSSLGLFMHPKQMRRHSDTAVSANSSSLHYKNVKRLVENNKRLPTLSGQTRPQQVGVAGRAPPPLPVGMPPKLYQYISEIWQKHSGTL